MLVAVLESAYINLSSSTEQSLLLYDKLCLTVWNDKANSAAVTLSFSDTGLEVEAGVKKFSRSPDVLFNSVLALCCFVS